MKRVWVSSFFLGFLFSGYALELNSGVDWWGSSKPQVEKKVKKEEKQSKQNRQIKVANPLPSKGEQLTAEEIFRKSVEEFENKLKKEKTLVEYLYFKDPSNPVYQEAYRKWIEWKQKKVIETTAPIIGYARFQHKSKYEVIDWLKRHKYVFLYFYRPDCPFCQATKSQVEELENLGFKVFWINAYEDPQMFERWHIRATPTLIAVSKYDKKAVRWEGVFNAYSVLQYFYARLRGEKMLYPNNLTSR